MNAVDWQRCGYKTIFRNGMVYMYRPSTGLVIYTEVNGGKWMEANAVNFAPWKQTTEDHFPQINFPAIARSCYCNGIDSGMIDVCDFCAGLRKPAHDDQPGRNILTGHGGLHGRKRGKL